MDLCVRKMDTDSIGIFRWYKLAGVGLSIKRMKEAIGRVDQNTLPTFNVLSAKKSFRIALHNYPKWLDCRAINIVVGRTFSLHEICISGYCGMMLRKAIRFV